ncbi:hypothetical protein VTJ04DRAFT_3539 [Mycothermus thermophilus]|uniref:uncharacterized protein n=1 Tax=Humicola insolens TaxID=85995 RepID=UPI0037426439
MHFFSDGHEKARAAAGRPASMELEILGPPRKQPVRQCKITKTREGYFYCPVCKKVLKSKQGQKYHMNSDEHYRKLEQWEEAIEEAASEGHASNQMDVDEEMDG